MTDCFCHAIIPAGWSANLKLIDHRYFYHLDDRGDDRGYYTCDLVRNAVADQLFEEGRYFADTDFLISLPRFIDNRSVAVFMIEA